MNRILEIVQKHSCLSNSLLFSRKCSSFKTLSSETFRRPREINIASLTGTIEHQVKRLRGGAIQFYLRTLNEDKSYFIHKIIIKNEELLSYVEGSRLKVNERIHVGGKIKTEYLSDKDDKNQIFEVIANEIYFTDSNIDQNYVELQAHIVTKVHNNLDCSAFNVATHFTMQKGKPNESEGSNFHRIIVPNNDKLLDVAQHLWKFDRIHLTGFINYKQKYGTNRESTQTNGFIEVTNLAKLKKFNDDY